MILLTGGTGFVGRHLARQLIADGRRVRVLSRTPGRVALPDAVSWAQGDLADVASLRVALRDVRTVVHAAAVLPSGQASDALLERVNADGTESLARLARDIGVRQFIHISSAEVYGDGYTAVPHLEGDTPHPGTPYQRSKLSAEHALTATFEGTDIRRIILRPPILYGPDGPATAAFFREVAHRRFWLHGPARAVMQPTYIADLAAAVRLVIDRDDLQHEVINVGGARSLEFRQWISLVGKRVGRTPFQLSAPRWTRRLGALAERAWRSAGQPPALLLRLARTWINTSVSIEKAREVLGFEPVTLEWGLDQTVAGLRKEGLL